MTNPNTPRRICQTGLALSLGISVEFNIIGQSLATDSLAAKITMGALSLGSLIGAEIMCRAKMPAKRRGAKINHWQLIKNVGVGLATALIMTITFTHGYATMQHWGSDPLQSVIAPLAVDAMMILSGLILLVSPAARKRNKPKRVRKV